MTSSFGNRSKSGGGPGTPGAAGAAGSQWRTGAGVPSNATGVDTDQYLNTTTGDVYTRAAGVYTVTGNIRGATGPTATAIPAGTLTGGTLGNLVLRVPGTNTCVDADRWMKTELKRQQYYWLDLNGVYWLPGSLVTVTAGQTAGNIVALNSITAAGGVNWTTFVPGAQPASLDFTSTLGYVEIGAMETATLMRFSPRAPLFLDDNAITAYNPVSQYANGAALPADFSLQYSATSSFIYAPNPANVNMYPNNKIFELSCNDSLQHALAWETYGATAIGSFLDGEVQTVMNHGGNTGSMLLNARMTGAAGSETRLFASCSTSAGAVRVFTQVAGAASVQVATVNMTLANDTGYRIRLGFYGPYTRVKVWANGTTEPAAWTLTCYQTAVLGAGKCGPGVSGSGGTFYNRFGDLSVCQNFGSAPLA